MKEHLDQSNDTVNLTAVAEDDTVILDGEPEACATQACEYCGHWPCGCGG